MPNKMSELTSLQSLFLMVLKDTGREMSGAEIVAEIGSKLGQDWVPTPGAVYKILRHLLQEDLVVETTKEDRRDKRRRTYQITEKGKEGLRPVMEQATALFRFMSRCCAEYCVPCSYCCGDEM